MLPISCASPSAERPCKPTNPGGAGVGSFDVHKTSQNPPLQHSKGEFCWCNLVKFREVTSKGVCRPASQWSGPSPARPAPSPALQRNRCKSPPLLALSGSFSALSCTRAPSYAKAQLAGSKGMHEKEIQSTVGRRSIDENEPSMYPAGRCCSCF